MNCVIPTKPEHRLHESGYVFHVERRLTFLELHISGKKANRNKSDDKTNND